MLLNSKSAHWHFNYTTIRQLFQQSIFHNSLRPATTVHSYNTRSSTKLNFYRPQVRTNMGKFTLKHSASVTWETVPLALKKANTLVLDSTNIFYYIPVKAQCHFFVYLKVDGGQLESFCYFDHHTHFVTCNHVL